MTIAFSPRFVALIILFFYYSFYYVSQMAVQAFRANSSFRPSKTRWVSVLICAAHWHNLRIQEQVHFPQFTANLYLPGFLRPAECRACSQQHHLFEVVTCCYPLLMCSVVVFHVEFACIRLLYTILIGGLICSLWSISMISDMYQPTQRYWGCSY